MSEVCRENLVECLDEALEEEDSSAFIRKLQAITNFIVNLPSCLRSVEDITSMKEKFEEVNRRIATTDKDVIADAIRECAFIATPEDWVAGVLSLPKFQTQPNTTQSD